ncbi:Transcriptional regulatory protein DegU [Anaerolineales bacterium]|nr:Transcriptional regulatory protein DegU [Anaerolineales bacterium]
MVFSNSPPTPRHLQILIVCPYKLALDGLKVLVEQEEDLHVISMVSGVQEAISASSDLKPDVVLVGDGWPGLSCTAVIERLRGGGVTAPILFLSYDVEPEHVQLALAAGATGYLPLDAGQDELLRMITSVSQGEVSLHPVVLRALLIHLEKKPAEARDRAMEELTPREQDVLACLAQGLSDRDIAQSLFISVRTVQTHLAHIFDKFHTHSRTEVALIAARKGWSGQEPNP